MMLFEELFKCVQCRFSGPGWDIVNLSEGPNSYTCRKCARANHTSLAS